MMPDKLRIENQTKRIKGMQSGLELLREENETLKKDIEALENIGMEKSQENRAIKKQNDRLREFVKRVSYGHFKTIEAMKVAQKCLKEMNKCEICEMPVKQEKKHSRRLDGHS